MIIQENTIIHGDSLTVLRQMEPESVDAIITDPPYGINYVSQTGASIKNDKSPFIWFLYDALRSPDISVEEFSEQISTAQVYEYCRITRVSKPRGRPPKAKAGGTHDQ